MAKIISTYENNFNNNKMKKLILEIPLNPNEIFDFFFKQRFSYCQIHFYLKSQYAIQPEHILRKYNSNNKNNINDDTKQFINSLSEINRFFNKY